MQWIEDDSEITLDNAPYEPMGGADELFGCRDEEVLLEGPAGTGKSRALLEKIHLALCKYDGAKALIVRATRVSMTHSVLVTFEDKVLPVGHYLKRGASRGHRDSYLYHNNSELVTGGLDRPDRLMSTEYDIIGVFEATEVQEDAFDKLTTRLRNGVMPYQQIVADCNPAGPTHWLNERASTQRMTRILSRHTDNPSVTDAYLAKLNNLQGALRERLLLGRWVQSDGLVYDNFSREANVAALAGPWKKSVLCCDDGYTDPFVLIRLEIDPDGRAHASRLIYRTGMVEAEKVAAVREFWTDDTEAVACDSAAASLIAAIRGDGLNAVASKKGPDSIVNGCHKVRARMGPAGDGRARLTFDPGCVEVFNELDTYEWSKRQDGSTKDKPVDQNNHAMDALRYGVEYLDAGVRAYAEVVGGPEEPAEDGRSVAQVFADNRKDPDWGF